MMVLPGLIGGYEWGEVETFQGFKNGAIPTKRNFLVFF
jgi:hypothetical protein